MGDYYGNQQQQQQQPPKKPQGGLDQGKIFVGGLSWQTTEESLRWHFEQYGPVVSVEVMRDRVTGDPRGFAFVVFREQLIIGFQLGGQAFSEIIFQYNNMLHKK